MPSSAFMEVATVLQIEDAPIAVPLPYEGHRGRFYIDPPDGDARTYVAIVRDGSGDEKRYFIARYGRLRH